MTIKELKQGRVFRAIRRDNNFKSNLERITAAEKEIHAAGWKITGSVIDGARVRYHVYKKTVDSHKWYITEQNRERVREIARRYMQRESLPITREYMEGDYLVMETDRVRETRGYRLNRAGMDAAEISGELIIRSKDYIFRFEYDGIRKELYGPILRADMIEGDSIRMKSPYADITYIITEKKEA